MLTEGEHTEWYSMVPYPNEEMTVGILRQLPIDNPRAPRYNVDGIRVATQPPYPLKQC